MVSNYIAATIAALVLIAMSPHVYPMYHDWFMYISR